MEFIVGGVFEEIFSSVFGGYLVLCGLGSFLV